MRFKLVLPALAVLAVAFSPAPVAAQVEPSADNAITCAVIYRYLGDRGPAYERLVAKNAELTGRTVAAVKADLDEREPRLRAGIADGRLEAETMVSLGTNACPNTFGVAPANRSSASAAASGGSSPQPDPVRCAGLARWFDSTYPANAWGTTWAGDEMVRRAASAGGLSYDAMNSRASGFVTGGAATGTLIDEMVRCQEAYDTPIPPGAVLAAARHGDRPGVERGRIHHCQALANTFDGNLPDASSYESAIWRHPPSGLEQASGKLESLQWYFKEMDKAQCPAYIVQPRIDAFTSFADRMTAAAQQAKDRLEREGRWW